MKSIEEVLRDFGIKKDEKERTKELFREDLIQRSVSSICGEHGPSKEKLISYFKDLFLREIDEEYIEEIKNIGTLHEEKGISEATYIKAFSRWIDSYFSSLSNSFISFFKNVLLNIFFVIDSYEKQHEERYEKIIDSIGYAVILVDKEKQKISMANKDAEKLFGISKEKLSGVALKEITESSISEEREMKINVKTKDGEIPVLCKTKKYSFRNKDYILCVIRDIRKEIELDRQAKLLTRLYDALSSINQLITTEDDKKRLFEKACLILKEKAGFKYVSINKKGKEQPIVEIGNYSKEDPALCISIRNYGEEYVLNVTISKDIEIIQKEKMLLEEVASDLSFALNRIGSQEKLADVVYYDDVTRLPNRTYFHQYLREIINRARTNVFKVAVIIVIIDRFDEFEYSLGRHFSEELIKKISVKIRDRLRKDTLLARIERDRFAIALEARDSKTVVEKIITRIKKAFSEPFYLNRQEISVSLSFGISIFPYDAETEEKLILNAMLAAESANKLGGNTAIYYKEELTTNLKDKLFIRSELGKALKRKEFQLFYQPKVDLKTNLIVGAEALLRWIKDGQIIPPYRFIPFLEEGNLMNDVGKWVIEEACRQMEEWRKIGININVAVNISPVQLSTPSFIDDLISTIFSCKSDGLEIEITESLLMQDTARSIFFLNELMKKGIKTYIDDFGTGYSSFAYLKKIPVYAIKIAREFIKDIPENKEDIEIVKTIVKIANVYNLKTVAEGPETEEQVKILKEIGCDYAQGYYFSRPLPAEKFTDYFLSRLST